MEIEKLKNKIICGDCLGVMKDIPDKSVDLVITSPPYDNLRDYKGYSFNFKGIAKELFRVIKDGGVVVWVVGDATIKGSETGTSFKQALYFKEIGFNLHDTMIYAKDNPIPLTHNRYEQQFEYMFVFGKGKPKTFNPLKNKTISRGKSGKFYHTAQQEETTQAHSKNKTGEEKYKNNIWFYRVGGSKIKHPAIFPEKLAEDHIVSWSNEGDLVLDPMNGSGTTTKMAKLLKRNYIGIEISPEYCKIAEQRLRQNILL